MMTFESIAQKDLKEMCKMSLADLEPREAAAIVVSHLRQDELTDGKIEQISIDMLDNNLWEEFADLTFHEDFFNAYSLLREAFNGTFSEPTGVNFKIKVNPKEGQEALGIFQELPKIALTRLLASGLEESAVLNRLYSEQIEGNSFKDAENIIWHASKVSESEDELVYEITSSEFWFGELEAVDSFEAKAHSDESSNLEDD